MLGAPYVAQARVQVLGGVGGQARLGQALKEVEEGPIERIAVVEALAGFDEGGIPGEVDGGVGLREVCVAGCPGLRAEGQEATLEHHQLPVVHLQRPGTSVDHRQGVEHRRQQPEEDGRQDQVPKGPPQPRAKRVASSFHAAPR